MYQSTNFFKPSSKLTRGSYPKSRLAAETSACVNGTSPVFGIGTYSRIASFPRCFSNVLTKSDDRLGRVFPKLYILNFGFFFPAVFSLGVLLGSLVSQLAMTPLATSSMYVKSLANSEPPGPVKILIGFLSRCCSQTRSTPYPVSLKDRTR